MSAPTGTGAYNGSASEYTILSLADPRHFQRRINVPVIRSTAFPNRKHIFAVVMEPGVMSSAQPSDPQWLFVLIVMGVDSFDTAHFTSFPIDLTCL